MFDRVLVANRGEIAIRVVRACRDLGVETVAVYSEADEGALHTKLADEAVPIGPAPSAESYLVMEKHTEAAHEHGAEAIHPGYGFLAENADFAEHVQDEGLTFVGPEPGPMRTLGNKVEAREAAIEHGVPVSEGSEGAIREASEARAVAEEVGYPLMVKAAAGGGGIGMRIVESEDELEGKIEDARSQAEAAFGVPDVFVEKYLTDPRHIEVQVVGDEHGAVLHLGERECSIQRRYQKLIEEAPSPALDPEERADIGKRAAALAEAVGYTNAGTLEFLYQDGSFHFNEVNTRLQVEHTCTEMVTGIDIVKLQLQVAAGEPLDIRQEDVEIQGHSIECRINAEDPTEDFRPNPGHLEAYRAPSGPGVRVDDGVEPGFTIPDDYDSLVGKLLTWGRTREEATDRMARALDEYVVEGFPTVIPFHQRVMQDEAWRAGDLSTNYLDDRPVLDDLEAEVEEQAHRDRSRAAAVAAALTRAPGGGVRGLARRRQADEDDDAGGSRLSPWVQEARADRGGW
jgi:pyruvate carboxylase subunit A